MIVAALALYLDQISLGEYEPTSAGGTIFLEELPQSPDAAIALFSTGGPQASGKHGYDSPVVNVHVRGAANDVIGALAKATAIYDALHGLHSMALPGGIRVINCLGLQSGPITIGRDQNDRPRYSLNFQLEVRNVSANRE